jgi:hypothetical protein
MAQSDAVPGAGQPRCCKLRVVDVTTHQRLLGLGTLGGRPLAPGGVLIAGAVALAAAGRYSNSCMIREREASHICIKIFIWRGAPMKSPRLANSMGAFGMNLCAINFAAVHSP